MAQRSEVAVRKSVLMGDFNANFSVEQVGL
jgi:hypothetical protein